MYKMEEIFKKAVAVKIKTNDRDERSVPTGESLTVDKTQFLKQAGVCWRDYHSQHRIYSRAQEGS